MEREYQRSQEQIRREAEADSNREWEKERSEIEREKQAIERLKQQLNEDIIRTNKQRAEQKRRQQKPPEKSEFSEGFYEIVPEPDCRESKYVGSC